MKYIVISNLGLILGLMGLLNKGIWFGKGVWD